MYVVNITYTAPLDRIDDALEAHRAFLGQQFDAGVFIAAGPKLPRTGGIILAARIDRERLDAFGRSVHRDRLMRVIRELRESAQRHTYHVLHTVRSE